MTHVNGSRPSSSTCPSHFLSPTIHIACPPPPLFPHSNKYNYYCRAALRAPGLTSQNQPLSPPTPAAVPPSSDPPAADTTLSVQTQLLSFVAVLLLVMKLAGFLHIYWWRPLRIRRLMREQGVMGPTPRFMVGNLAERNELRRAAIRDDMEELSHDIVPRLLPDYVKWSQVYGKRFLFWWGTEARLVVCEAEEIRQVLVSRSGSFRRSELQRRGARDFIGAGLLMANGGAWAHQRRLLSPVFHHHRLKAHIGSLVECSMEIVRRWEELLQTRVNEAAARSSCIGIASSETFRDTRLENAKVAVEVEAGDEMNWLAADMIARTQFGSSLAALGKGFFANLSELQKLCTQTSQYRCRRRRMKELKGDIETSLLTIIQERRRDAASKLHAQMLQQRARFVFEGTRFTHRQIIEAYGDDFLGVLLAEMESNTLFPTKTNHNQLYTLQQVLDECKTFFFTGHDTIGLLLTWTLMLLASNPIWQDRAREEILQVSRGSSLDAEMLGKLKIVGMVVWESLRLYPPAAMLAREASEEVEVGGVRVPEGVSVWIPALALHHDPALWGPTAHLFDPSRFSDNAGGSSSSLFLPFSAGPRACVGQQAALLHARLALAILLPRFAFTLSPRYRHAPTLHLTLRPRHGLPLLLSRPPPPFKPQTD